ncbi:hypothetical protein TNCV_4842841 [Trichonephila clavipes]|uniref:Uncharacterized protein n=1 Tax=Trichonephila clavipes TaxID=2585209 RepID=A0A8X7BMM1_TRICX|nr:hypothetical protein TNCV_4842841 [Trichonephila clavipes]
MWETHIFSSLHKALKGRGLPNDNEIEAFVENWFHNQHWSFFTRSFHHVVGRWDTCSNPQSEAQGWRIFIEQCAVFSKEIFDEV